MTTATQTYDRAELENMPGQDRPRVRVKYDCDFTDEDGRRTTGVKETTGYISVSSEKNPWVVIFAGGKEIAEKFSWGLVLEVLNDPYAPPIWFSTRVPYEV